ncbi:hypothetical protein CMI47_19345 [Candidatus Pacearchaeota archaeon]|nr:hypothetical protein [Candidatus Pacearchaeota archaeon]|tara:strand:- start:702 stop:935 length:234 start_codon:yes stop_codon:yes gene_type:complete
MIKVGDFIAEKNLLVIRRLDWSDVERRLDEAGCFEGYPHVYKEEKARFYDHIHTHDGLWEVMDSDGQIGIMLGERKR